ncbi:hypothetical protein F2P81_024883 [Scophthalmus maximus]|uniref:SKI/SNO/DAC domain-containing protein n=1 Tax=Scophthalmus maximus TaxID=52904 RepID=A0A6A4RV18_SCOMX|nr:hypothetical protein F2P81_024883 [Scophthalmus maximus]
MAGCSNTPLSRTSTPPTDPIFHSDPPYGAPNLLSSPRFAAAAAARFSGAPAHSDCAMVEVRGVKVASFTVSGVELICLPQVFELFLKHLVGGLHTVYTKLKRLHISPVVCTVEQVRVLRGLGAIQPGVNRCKLITRSDFDTLYRDCTNASSRPGRPPKRTLGVATMSEGSRLLPHGLLSPALLSQTGLTAAMAEALKLQKMRMMMGFHGNSDQHRHRNGAESDNDETGGSEGSWEKEQRLLPPHSSGVAPPPLSASHRLNTLQQHSSLLANHDSALPLPVLKPTNERLPLTSHPLSVNHANHTFAPFLLAEGLSSMETLLTNIQGLLKVAMEGARSQSKQNQLERKDLKLELERERDVRQTLQRQLSTELQTRVSMQRRLKKEKKAKRKLQEALDGEWRRRQQVERALKHCDSLTDLVTPENEAENKLRENLAAHENQTFTKPPLVF